MVYITEIEWLRARWMVLHNFARIAESDFELFEAPDLTPEEIRDCDFDDLATLIEFVQPTEAGRIRQIRTDLQEFGYSRAEVGQIMSEGIRCDQCGALLQAMDFGEMGFYLSCLNADNTETHTERRLDPPATSQSTPGYVTIRIYRADRDLLAARMRYGETMADAIHALIEPARDDAEGV
jgi:hypothetical protein